MRAPIGVYKARLGFLFGSRMLMLEHIGRVSGARRYVVLEVFGHPTPDVYLVVSGFGSRSQWFRNLQADPSARVWVRGRRGVPARASRLGDVAADAALESYVAQHARAWAKFRSVVENTLGRPVQRGSDLDVMALQLEPDVLERVTGIEPAFSAWEADVLPLNYTRTDRARLQG